MYIKLRLKGGHLNIVDMRTDYVIYEAHYSPDKYRKIKEILPEDNYDLEKITELLALFRNMRGIHFTKEEVQKMLSGEVKRDG